MPEISVVIPAYNVEKYIGKVIGDLENQTFKDFELIIVDDGSKDSTFAVAQEILKNTKINYKMIRLERNSGVSKARNVGLSNATGNYIYFVDADDRIEKELLYTLKKDIEETNSDIAICNYNFVDADNNILPKSFSLSLKKNMIFRNIELINKIINGYYPIYTGCVLYKKRSIDEHKIKFIEGAKYMEDYEFIIKAIYHSNRIVLESKILFHYVEDPTSVTMNTEFINMFHNIFHSIGSVYRLAKYLELQNAPRDILDCIYEIRIPSEIATSLRRLIYYNYPKDKLKLLLKSKKIVEAISKYKFSLKSKKDLRRSIKIYLLKSWPGIFFLIAKLKG